MSAHRRANFLRRENAGARRYFRPLARKRRSGGVQPARLLPLLLLFSVALHARSSLDNARRAQALLGPEIWSQLIRVENQARSRPYPRVVHALVFELSGILWFYTDTDGTQSFSLHEDNLAEEKADFAPLLRDISPGFARWKVLPDADPRGATHDGSAALRNGCFIESVAALRDRIARGQLAEAPHLLSYYTNTPEGKRGHTVLIYGSGGSVHVFDPAHRDKPLAFAATEVSDALSLARAVHGPGVIKARYLPLRLPAPAVIAASPRASGNGS